MDEAKVTEEATVEKKETDETKPVSGVYLVRLTLRGDDPAPVLAELESVIEDATGDAFQMDASASAERVDR